MGGDLELEISEEIWDKVCMETHSYLCKCTERVKGRRLTDILEPHHSFQNGSQSNKCMLETVWREGCKPQTHIMDMPSHG